MIEGVADKAGELELIHRLGDRNLRLKPGIKLHPQNDIDGQYIVESQNGEQFFYCDADTAELIEALDGQASLTQVIDKLQIGSQSYDALELALSKFIKYGLISGLDNALSNSRWWHVFKQPIAMKFPLLNPDSFLNHIYRYTGSIFNRYFIILFISLLSLSIYQLPLQWELIHSHWQSRFFDPVNGLLLVCAYVFLKSLHEIAHGLVVKRYGGVVNECGIFMLVFLPLPYVNTSSSYSFSKRKHRILVGAAGMWVELIIAMIAFFLWQHTSPSHLADFLFNLVFVGSVSTLVFNLNPLMRFDGYYILSDYLGIFNLNSRSRDALSTVIKRYLFKLEVPDNSELSGSVKRWLILYALCAAPYRLFIGLVIAFYLAGQFFVFGVILACWVLFQLLVVPIVRQACGMYQEAKKNQKVKQFMAVAVAFLTISFSLVFVMGFNFSDSQIAMVIEPENYQVNAPVNGVVTSIHYESGDQVEKGAVLARLENSELAVKYKIAEGLLHEYKAQYRLEGLGNISQAQSWQEKITIQQREVDLLQERLDNLDLIAPVAGEFVLSRGQDFIGRYIKRGESVAKVFKPNQVKLLVVVSEEQVRRLNKGIDSIEIRFNSAPGDTYRGSILRVKPAAVSELPSRFMGSSVGGLIAVDSRDQSGLKTMSPFFLVEVQVDRDSTKFLPAMGMVRFIYKQMTVIDYFLADFYHRYTQKLY